MADGIAVVFDQGSVTFSIPVCIFIQLDSKILIYDLFSTVISTDPDSPLIARSNPTLTGVGYAVHTGLGAILCTRCTRIIPQDYHHNHYQKPHHDGSLQSPFRHEDVKAELDRVIVPNTNLIKQYHEPQHPLPAIAGVPVEYGGFECMICSDDTNANRTHISRKKKDMGQHIRKEHPVEVAQKASELNIPEKDAKYQFMRSDVPFQFISLEPKKRLFPILVADGIEQEEEPGIQAGMDVEPVIIEQEAAGHVEETMEHVDIEENVEFGIAFAGVLSTDLVASSPVPGNSVVSLPAGTQLDNVQNLDNRQEDSSEINASPPSPAPPPGSPASPAPPPPPASPLASSVPQIIPVPDPLAKTRTALEEANKRAHELIKSVFDEALKPNPPYVHKCMRNSRFYRCRIRGNKVWCTFYVC